MRNKLMTFAIGVIIAILITWFNLPVTATKIEDSLISPSSEPKEIYTVSGNETDVPIISSDTSNIAIDQHTVSEGDIGINEVTPNDTNLLETLDIGDIQEQEIIHVQAPPNIDFALDPYEIHGNGTLWSNTYEFHNNGTSTILLKLENVRCIPKDNIEVRTEALTSDEIENFKEKFVYLKMMMDTGDSLLITEDSTDYQIILEPEEALSFYFDGNISRSFNNSWQTNDIMIEMNYKITIITESTTAL